MSKTVLRCVVANPPEYHFYEKQPWRDLTGVPPGLDHRCTLNRCRGIRRPVPGTQEFDVDGHATVDTKCDACSDVVGGSWWWTKNPPAENAQYDNRTLG